MSVACTRLEVATLDGQMRADAVLRGAVGDVDLTQVCVEVRVHHAVDHAKCALVREHGLDVIEIDLSELDEDLVADQEAFKSHVLEDADNRHWINLTTGRYIAEHSDRTLIEVVDTSVAERVLTTKTGKPFTIREQWAYLVKPGSREPVRLQVPDETVGEEATPYPKGLHCISPRSITVGPGGKIRLRYKMYLDRIEMNPREAEEAQLGLFAAQSTVEGQGFRVRPRVWLGRPGL